MGVPFILLHPEAVQVEDAHGAVAVLHPLEEGRDRLLVIGSQEGGGEPETECPRREKTVYGCVNVLTA